MWGVGVSERAGVGGAQGPRADALVWVRFGVGAVVGVCVRLCRAWLWTRALVRVGVDLGFGAWGVCGRGRVCGREVLSFFLFEKCFSF